jgi:hypothetical protein
MPLIDPPAHPAPASGPGPDHDDAAGVVPVFLDVTGRRLRRVRVLGAAAAFVVIGYLGLLVSAALGGPTIDAPFLPRPMTPNQLVAKSPKAGTATTAAPSSTGSPSATTRGATEAAVLEQAGATSSAIGTPSTRATALVSVTGTPTREATPTARPTTVPAATHTPGSPSAPGLTQRPNPTTSR